MSTIVLDIETTPTEVPEDYIAAKEAELREEYQREDTIQKYLAKAKDKWKFEIGGSNPICIGMINLRENTKWVLQSTDTALLLTSFLDKLSTWSSYSPTTLKLVGFNLLGFDIPQLHSALCRYNINPPVLGTVSAFPLRDTQILDLMYKPFGYQFTKRSLNYYLRAFGIPLKEGDGSLVQAMWEEDLKDNGARVSTYCMQDVERTAQLYRQIKIWRDI